MPEHSSKSPVGKDDVGGDVGAGERRDRGPGRGRACLALLGMECEAGWVPGQIDERQQAASFLLKIVDQRLVVKVVNPAGEAFFP